MKINPHIIQNLVTIIVNDGDGSQCGMTYRQRCDAAEIGIIRYRNAARQACEWSAAQGYARANRMEIIQAADEVQHYYRNHMKEQKRAEKSK